ncbi:MAG: hypothetical protein Q4G07_11635, partial [Oscillospiraceae bacterium]|nr:hypothetical protein [Oscillospiraceae bacterium]
MSCLTFPHANMRMEKAELGLAVFGKEDRAVEGVLMFNEICIYEAKIDKQDEIEALMKEVAEFYLSQPGVIDVKYIKRTHRQEDFNAVKEGTPPIRLTKWIGKVTYILHWTLENEDVHAQVSKLGLEQFYKRWNRCLTTMPKILLGENIV